MFADVDHRACFLELWEWYSTRSAWKVHEEAAEVFRDLQTRNIVLGMASNFDARLRSVAGSFSELTPVVGKCLISSERGYRKPSPLFFESIAELSGLPLDRILYVGDDLRNDYEGAFAAGMKAVLLDPSGQSTHSHAVKKLCNILCM